MIRFRFKGNKGHPEDIAFIGLSHNNLDALKRGRPIRIRASDSLGLAVELVIYSGRDEVEMTEELEKHDFVPEGSTDKTRKALSRRREFRLETKVDDDG